MRARRNTELVAVPGTYDSHIRLIESIADCGLFLGQQFTHGGNHQALAHGSALMGAGVFVRVEHAVYAKNSDGHVADIDHQTATLRHVIALRSRVLRRTFYWHLAIMARRI